MNPRPSPSTSQAGFTLAEMLVALAITALLLLGVLFTFDLNSRVARAQSYVSDLQQSLRIAQDDMVRYVRMTGRGNLPLTVTGSMPLPQGFALAVRDNVAPGQRMLASDPATQILPDTDVLTVRGVFGQLYQVHFKNAVNYEPNLAAPTSGTLRINNVSPGSAPQDLEPIKAAIKAANDSGTSEAILLTSYKDDKIRAVVELVAGGTIADDHVVVAFTITGGAHTADYAKLSTGGAFQIEDLQELAYAGILEEHRYYVREAYAVAGDPESGLTPKLARGRFYPGTNAAHNENASASLDLADNIADLQVALAFDTTAGGSGIPLTETDNGANDDWLFNDDDDDPEDAVWDAAVQYVRLTVLARTDRRDPYYQAPLLPSRIEDRAYSSGDPLNSYASREFRWQTLRTVIDLRNL